MMPIVHGLQQQFGSKVDFLYLDVQDPRTEVARARLGFVATPHMFLLDSAGNRLREWRGLASEVDLAKALDEVAVDHQEGGT